MPHTAWRNEEGPLVSISRRAQLSEVGCARTHEPSPLHPSTARLLLARVIASSATALAFLRSRSSHRWWRASGNITRPARVACATTVAEIWHLRSAARAEMARAAAERAEVRQARTAEVRTAAAVAVAEAAAAAGAAGARRARQQRRGGSKLRPGPGCGASDRACWCEFRCKKSTSATFPTFVGPPTR